MTQRARLLNLAFLMGGACVYALPLLMAGFKLYGPHRNLIVLSGFWSIGLFSSLILSIRNRVDVPVARASGRIFICALMIGAGGLLYSAGSRYLAGYLKPGGELCENIVTTALVLWMLAQSFVLLGVRNDGNAAANLKVTATARLLGLTFAVVGIIRLLSNGAIPDVLTEPNMAILIRGPLSAVLFMACGIAMCLGNRSVAYYSCLSLAGLIVAACASGLHESAQWMVGRNTILGHKAAVLFIARWAVFGLYTCCAVGGAFVMSWLSMELMASDRESV